MAHKIQISYLTARGYSAQLPAKLDQTWTEFIDINDLFPGIHFLTTEFLGGASPKNLGEDLPGRHGVVNFYSPVNSSNIALNFVARNAVNRETVKDNISKFLSWLYSAGEVRLSFDDERTYRRVIYNDLPPYRFFEGERGYDAEITLNLLCLDSVLYSKTATIIETVKYAAFFNDYDVYVATSPTLNNLTTLDNTPVKTRIFLVGQLMGKFFVVSSHDGETINMFALDVGEDAIPSSATIIIDAENPAVYWDRVTTSGDLTKYIVQDLPDVMMQYEHAQSVMPFARYGYNYFAVGLPRSPAVDARVTFEYTEQGL